MKIVNIILGSLQRLVILGCAYRAWYRAFYPAAGRANYLRTPLWRRSRRARRDGVQCARQRFEAQQTAAQDQ